LIEGATAVLWVKHGTSELEYGEGTSGEFTTSDNKGVSNAVFLIEIIVDEEDDDELDDEEEENDDEEEEKAEEVKEGYYDPYYEEEEQDTLMLDEEGSVGTDENEMFPENDYYEESDININDPAFYSGKSLGLPKAVSVWGTPRGMPDTQLPVAKQKSHVGMPINLTLNFTTRGNVDSLLPTMSGMFAEPGEE
jgi:hypothetical protein